MQVKFCIEKIAIRKIYNHRKITTLILEAYILLSTLGKKLTMINNNQTKSWTQNFLLKYLNNHCKVTLQMTMSYKNIMWK